MHWVGDIPLDEREVKSAEVKGGARYFDIPKDCCFESSNFSGDGATKMVQSLAQKVHNLHACSKSTELQDYSSSSKLLVALSW